VSDQSFIQSYFSFIIPFYAKLLSHESGSDNPFQRYIRSKFVRMAAGCHLGFFIETEI